jgi:Protein of unknown function (DUF1549)/Protein of unknown function (DUF1553)/Planctomycete cytochrome C
VVLSLGAVFAVAVHGQDIDFARQVRPILSQNCYACHGPDSEHREADLRLDTEEGMKSDNGGDIAVIPGDTVHSEMVRRIKSTSAKKHMPPVDSGKKLTPDQIATLEAWIKQGAKWSQFWSFVPPTKAPLPPVKDAAWVATPIDQFILARLEKEGLHPSPPANRRTLIRRVSFDLTGLPPTSAEVDAFMADQSPDAYVKLVDRLLASPAFGEKWARVWLDLARYADTNGYEKDRRREMWPYRDWLIAALNEDMPFDEFTVEQLAGDLLPHPTESQLIATTFNRNTMINEEGGVDGEEFRVEEVKDRVDTTVQVWMGLTMGCAKCHNHKYDPITQKEYYQFYGLFDQSEDVNSYPPTLAFLTSQQRDHDAPIEEKIEAMKKQLAAVHPATAPAAAPLKSQIDALDKQLIKPLSLPIMRDLPKEKRRVTHVQNRGSFLDPGQVVQPTVLSAFNPMPPEWPRNRLGMAYWLVDRHNPLTARVLVNRFWAQFFGTGIVESEEDFGTQGTPPSHQKLLDWLAVDTMEHGWSMKRLCRQIVMSNTYQQDSRTTPELIEKDRFNRLLGRGPRIRLDAEAVRDNALAVAGLLSRKIGGPSVMPIQPPGIWASVYSGDTWVTSNGEDQFRRGIYTFIKRTSPYPSAMTFDATSRETCTVRRIRTNTPLQALTTLNDPVYVEAAQALARKMIACGGDQPIAWAINQVLARPATATEIAALRGLHDRRADWFASHPKDAEQFATDPLGPLPTDCNPDQAAAWTAVCNVILNLDETLTKE